MKENIGAINNPEEAKNYADSKKLKFRLVSAKEDPQSFDEFLLELVKEYKVPEHKKKTVLNNNRREAKKSFC